MTLENKPAFDSYKAASPIGMLGEPEYIAEAVSYVVSAEFMTGQVISPQRRAGHLTCQRFHRDRKDLALLPGLFFKSV